MLSPEILREKFLEWQCQSRIQAFRTQNGRPNSSMTPILLDKKGNELSKIIVVIAENNPVNTTKCLNTLTKLLMIQLLGLTK